MKPGSFVCEACRDRSDAGDVLTGLADRRAFRAQLESALAGEGTAMEGAALAVLLIDLDRFKAVNDTMGDATGDALLIAVAGRIRSALRAGDVAPGSARTSSRCCFAGLTGWMTRRQWRGG